MVVRFLITICQHSQKLLNFSTSTIKLHNAITNNKFEKKNISDMHHRTTYMHIANFSRIGLVDQSKQCTQIYFQKIANCTNL